MATAKTNPAGTSRRLTSTGNSTAYSRNSKGQRQQQEMILESDDQRPFRRINIYMMCGCILLIIIGFLFMLGDGSSVEGGFNPDIFSTRRIVVGPTLTFLGFLLMAFAIIWSPRKKTTELTENEKEQQPT